MTFFQALRGELLTLQSNFEQVAERCEDLKKAKLSNSEEEAARIRILEGQIEAAKNDAMQEKCKRQVGHHALSYEFSLQNFGTSCYCWEPQREQLEFSPNQVFLLRLVVTCGR